MIEKIKSRIFLIIGIAFVISAISIIFIDYNKTNKEIINNDILVEEYFEEENKLIEEPIKEEVKEETKSSKTYNYIAILEIPSINLKRGLVDYNSRYNNVDYNIRIIEHSNMPNIENSNLILAAHNGSSNVSFFNKLDKLKEDSLVYLYHDNIKYIYKINNYYEAKKDGYVEIIRNRNKTTITLITCKKNTNDKHLVYIGYLVDKVEY